MPGPVLFGPDDERAMSTQPAAGSGAVPPDSAPPMEFSSAPRPGPEPSGRAKLQFSPAVPSTGVMISFWAPVTGLVAL